MMNTVVFICLLSLSTCLSRPDGLQGAAQPAPTTPVLKTIASETPLPSSTTKEEVSVPQHVDTQTNVTAPAQAATAPAHPDVNTTVATNTAVPTTNKTDADANKTTDKKEPPKKEDSTPTVAPTPKNDTVIPPNADKKENSTTPTDSGKKNDTTTVKPDVTPKPTETPKAADIPPKHARGFDGPSFIGGIILTLGLLAIGFMGFKYYKNQTERNYHTL